MNAKSIALLQVIIELLPFPILQYLACLKHISESINGNQMKHDAFIDGNEKRAQSTNKTLSQVIKDVFPILICHVVLF